MSWTNVAPVKGVSNTLFDQILDRWTSHKKTRTKNVNSRKRNAEERTRWKCQNFSSKTVYCEKYEKLEKENPAAWIADNDLTPFKVFEVLFGNNFERIRKETERYAQRRGNSDFSLLLAEVKCAVGS